MRIIQKVGRSPLEIFEEEERVVLNPLASKRWDPVTFKEPSVGTDWRVQIVSDWDEESLKDLITWCSGYSRALSREKSD